MPFQLLTSLHKSDEFHGSEMIRPESHKKSIWEWVWPLVPPPLQHRLLSVLRLWYALKMEGRSFVGRMKNRLDKKQWSVVIGVQLQRSETGHYQECEGTNARNASIKALTSRYPWANNTDVEILLLGFDAGEQFGARTCKQNHELAVSYSASQHNNADKGQTSAVTPAAIAGVTRKVE